MKQYVDNGDKDVSKGEIIMTKLSRKDTEDTLRG